MTDLRILGFRFQSTNPSVTGRKSKRYLNISELNCGKDAGESFAK